MRNWHFLIPIIAVAVWILSSLIRGAEEQRVRRPRPQAEPDEPPQPERPRRSATEIDRFLQEVQRRRRDTEERKPERERERRSEPVASEVLMAIPVEPVAVPTSRRTPRAERPQRRRQVDLQPLVATPVVTPVAELPLPTWQELHGSLMSSGPPAAPAPPPVPVGKQLRALLQSPQTVAVAFVLHEVFDRPISQRRRGHY